MRKKLMVSALLVFAAITSACDPPSEELDILRQDNESLKTSVGALKTANENLKAEVAGLKREIDLLIANIQKLTEAERLELQIATQKNRVETKGKEIAATQKEKEAAEERLKSLPPNSPKRRAYQELIDTLIAEITRLTGEKNNLASGLKKLEGKRTDLSKEISDGSR
jgi:chromosome segregation ATPase